MPPGTTGNAEVTTGPSTEDVTESNAEDIVSSVRTADAAGSRAELNTKLKGTEVTTGSSIEDNIEDTTSDTKEVTTEDAIEDNSVGISREGMAVGRSRVGCWVSNVGIVKPPEIVGKEPGKPSVESCIYVGRTTVASSIVASSIGANSVVGRSTGGKSVDVAGKSIAGICVERPVDMKPRVVAREPVGSLSSVGLVGLEEDSSTLLAEFILVSCFETGLIKPTSA
jgi:hypothetical protein